MPNLYDNYGLTPIFEDEEARMGLIGFVAENGKMIHGYYNAPTIFMSLGDIDFFLKLSQKGEKEYEIVGLDIHCGNSKVWNMRGTGIDITSDNALLGEKVLMLKRDDNSGLVPIHILNADILPSYFENELFQIQMVALPLEINYYANEDEYEASLPENERGDKYQISNGTFFPAQFLLNHSINNDRDDDENINDDVVLFTATVKALYYGTFNSFGTEHKCFIRCVVDTEYGEIEFDHTFEQVPEEMRSNIAVGSIISGACILSGDVAIYDYENGFIKNEENNLKLLHYAIEKGCAERLRKVLSEDAEYISEASDETFVGKGAIIKRFNYVNQVKKSKHFSYTATITKVDDDKLEYGVGTRCIVISYDEPDNYSAITFIDVSEDGDIKKIHVSTDEKYHFAIDNPPNEKSLFDDFTLPDSSVESMITRAKFLRMIEEDVSADGLINDSCNCGIYKNNATRMIDHIIDNPTDSMSAALKNIFGYLFAKAIENAINESKHLDDYDMYTASAYSYTDAVNGILQSNLTGDDYDKLKQSLEEGKHFFNDFNFYVKSKNLEGEDFCEEAIRALVMVQLIGEKTQMDGR